MGTSKRQLSRSEGQRTAAVLEQNAAAVLAATTVVVAAQVWHQRILLFLPPCMPSSPCWRKSMHRSNSKPLSLALWPLRLEHFLPDCLLGAGGKLHRLRQKKTSTRYLL